MSYLQKNKSVPFLRNRNIKDLIYLLEKDSATIQAIVAPLLKKFSLFSLDT